MQQININELKPHPRNNEFFDDITGNRWEDLLESIKRRGVIQSIIITADKTIVSGHQRVRACKELGIKQVKFEMNEYSTEDEILEDLISINLKQRVIGNDNPVKLGRCFKELERIYGIEYGGDRKSSGTKFNLKTQENLAKEYGISTKMLSNYKKLTTLIPEIQDLVENETVSPTVASRILTKLTVQEQEELISKLDVTKKYTQKQIKQYIEKNKKLENKVSELQNQEPKVIDNTDYMTIKQKEEELKRLRDDFRLRNEKILLLEKKIVLYEKDSEDFSKLKKQLENLSKQKDDLSRQITAVMSISGLVVEIENLLKNKLAPIKYSRAITEAKNDEIVINNLNEIINSVQSWCDEMKKYLSKENVEFIDVEVI